MEEKNCLDEITFKKAVKLCSIVVIFVALLVFTVESAFIHSAIFWRWIYDADPVNPLRGAKSDRPAAVAALNPSSDSNANKENNDAA